MLKKGLAHHLRSFCSSFYKNVYMFQKWLFLSISIMTYINKILQIHLLHVHCLPALDITSTRLMHRLIEQ